MQTTPRIKEQLELPLPHSIELHTTELNGTRIAYSDDTEFLVQIGKGSSAYKTRYSFKGNLHQAVRYFNCINIGNGYKKRLLMPSSPKPVLARAFS
jgi:hypothetical protein